MQAQEFGVFLRKKLRSKSLTEELRELVICIIINEYLEISRRHASHKDNVVFSHDNGDTPV